MAASCMNRQDYEHQIVSGSVFLHKAYILTRPRPSKRKAKKYQEKKNRQESKAMANSSHENKSPARSSAQSSPVQSILFHAHSDSQKKKKKKKRRRTRRRKEIISIPKYQIAPCQGPSLISNNPSLTTH